MQFKVYRCYDSMRLRKIAVCLMVGKDCVDKTYLFGYGVPFLKMRIKMRQKAMLRLCKAMAAMSVKV